MNIEDLTDTAVEKYLGKILKGLENSVDSSDPDYSRQLLQELVDFCDQLDCEDFLGTEGWRENFGIDI